MAFCPSCGKSLPEGSKFCAECGNRVEWQIERLVKIPREKRKVPAIIYVAVACVVALVLILMAIIGASQNNGSKGGLPWEPTYSATLELTLFNDDWLNSRSYEVYADGAYQVSGTVNALSTTERTMQVEWKGSSQHQCNIEVYAGGAKLTTTCWLTDGMSGSAALTI